jgi:hypothetical protein
MSEEWQFNFRVKGLVAPIEGLTHDNMQIKGLPPSDDAIVSFRVPFATTSDKNKLRNDLKSKLSDIAKIYGLIANQHLEISY